MEVTFDPTSPGAKTAALRVTSNDFDEPTVDVALTGTAYDPATGYTSPVWVDPNYTGVEMGTESQPCNTVDEAAALVLSGGTVKVKPGACNENLCITKPMRIEAASGPVTIGE